MGTREAAASSSAHLLQQIIGTTSYFKSFVNVIERIQRVQPAKGDKEGCVIPCRVSKEVLHSVQRCGKGASNSSVSGSGSGVERILRIPKSFIKLHVAPGRLMHSFLSLFHLSTLRVEGTKAMS